MQEVIRVALEEVLADMGLSEVVFVVEHPSDLAHGDYSCNVVMVLAKQLGKAPRVIAEQFCAELKDKIEYVDRVEVAGAGFINFYLSRDFFANEINRAVTDDKEWGKNDSWSGKKVLVEYTDPNPFKEFHIGHLFTNAVGESIARLFMMNGADTKRVNYQGDVGLHVAHAIWGMISLGINPDSNFSARDLGKAYALGATTYKNDENVQVEIRAINKKIYDRSDEKINELYDVGRKVSLAYFETIYKIIDTKFDAYFFESEAGPKGKDLILSHPEVFVESDGAHIFKGEDYGLHTRVFLNKEGLPTYEAKELALSKLKEERLGAYDLSVVSTANEINEYFKVLKKAMSFVYPDLSEKTEHIGHGMVRLITGKMSSRTGDVIAAKDFIEEVADEALEKMTKSGHVQPDNNLAQDVAIAAIKYSTLRGSISHDSIFDKEKSLSFEGDSGPYLQYTHARIGSVLEKAEDAGLIGNIKSAPEIPYTIERLIYQFPEVIEEALKERAPHKVVGYLTDLAGEFNSFYGQEKIADTEDVHAPYKIMIARAVKVTIKNGLWVLGIKTPDKM